MQPKSLIDLAKQAQRLYKPNKRLDVVGWADTYRILPPGSSEPGPWKTSRTPYMAEPMNCAADPKIHQITVASAAQVGKSELLLNILGYLIHMKPGPIVYMLPTEDMAEEVSAERIQPMFDTVPALRRVVSAFKGRDAQNKRLSKRFAGGHLYLRGANSPNKLRSVSAKVLFLDEVDAYKSTAGREGNPIDLIYQRTRTYPDRLIVSVSTPTIKGDSMIAELYMDGTQERYMTECPHCHQYNEIKWENIHAPHHSEWVNNREVIIVDKDVLYECPHCGCFTSEKIMKKQPTKWVAENPIAYEKGHRSFWLNAFTSPWLSWREIAQKFFETKDDPKRLQTTINTMFGELWENRGSLKVDETGLLERREDYGINPDGTPVEVPDEVAFLTMAVDTQDTWFEYEILGHGKDKETWGIKHGKILGSPIDPKVQEQLRDCILQKRFFKGKEKYLTPSLTFIDSGGHFSSTVKRFCKGMQGYGVYPIKGRGGDDVDFTSPPKPVQIEDSSTEQVMMVQIGTNEGKNRIMTNLSIKEPGPRYCHFPANEEAGYGRSYFLGLISERLDYDEKKHKTVWTPIEGRKRNEPLDLRNYNLAAAELSHIDPEKAIARRLNIKEPTAKKKPVKKRRRPRRVSEDDFDDW